jgi:PAS domain S-box-containing protein
MTATLPWRAVLIIVGSVFLGELIVMLVVIGADATRPLFGLLDALFVSILSFVLLRQFVLQPMVQSNERLQVEVTEHRRTAKELHIQTAALQAAANGVMITDQTGKILWVNPAFVAMTGYTLADIKGETPAFLTSGYHDTAFYDDLWQTILAGNVWQGETTNQRKDGTLYIEEQTITPVRDDTGQLTHFIAIKTDCTERKQAEVQLAQRNQQLLALSQEERRHRQFAEALALATRSLNSSLMLEEVLDRILEQTQAIVPCHAVVVMLLRGNWVDVARHRHATGATIELVHGFPLDLFPGLRSMATSRTPRLIVDTMAEPAWPPIPGLEWVRSLGVAPLVEYDRVTGFLAVVNEQGAFFNEETIECVVAFAAQAAVALQNARLYTAELDARRTAETLSAASLDLTRTLELQAVLESLLGHLGQLIAYDGAHIALRTDERQLTVRATTGDDPWAAPEPERPPATLDMVDDAVLQTLFQERQGLILSDPQLEGGSAYFAGLAAMRSWLGVPIVVGDQAVGLCAMTKRVAGFFHAEQMRLAEVMAAQASVTIQNAALFQQVQTSNEQLQLLSHRLVQVQENERRAIARELHDQSSQVLTSLKIGLRQLERTANNPTTLRSSIARLCDTTESVLEDLHRLAMDLRPATLDHLGLVVTLTDYVENFNQQHEVQSRFEAVGFDPQVRLAADMETALFRIVQEALTNVVRHARATRVDLLLNLFADRVRLTIEDDGIGFDPLSSARPSQMGLLGMRERCEMLGGRFNIERAPGFGTTLVVELPRHNRSPDHP